MLDVYKLIMHPYGKKHSKKVRKKKKDLNRIRKESVNACVKILGSKKKYKEVQSAINQRYKEFLRNYTFTIADKIKFNPPVEENPIEESYKQSFNRLGGFRL